MNITCGLMISQVIYMGLLCAIIYKQWVLNNSSLVNFINKIIIFVQLK